MNLMRYPLADLDLPGNVPRTDRVAAPGILSFCVGTTDSSSVELPRSVRLTAARMLGLLRGRRSELQPIPHSYPHSGGGCRFPAAARQYHMPTAGPGSVQPLPSFRHLGAMRRAWPRTG